MRPSKNSKRLQPKKDRPNRWKEQMSNLEQAALKAKISKAPLKPNREPFDQGTSI